MFVADSLKMGTDGRPSPVPKLAYGLERVLFNPGPHFLQCPRTGVFNFDPSLQMSFGHKEFNFDLLKRFVPAPHDADLLQMAARSDCRYATSTSSLCAPLVQLFFAFFGLQKAPTLNDVSLRFKNASLAYVNMLKMPVSFVVQPHRIPNTQRVVHSIFLEKSPEPDEESATTNAETPNILMRMGHVFEKKVTLPPASFATYRIGSGRTQADVDGSDAYAFCRAGRLMVRSQLDCGDSRLPLRSFDIKSRATLPVRMDVGSYAQHAAYRIYAATGMFNSFEREFYDMARSSFLKYSFQVRLGRMDGLFVVFHNVDEIFGFEYVARERLDAILFGNGHTADVVFGNLLKVFEAVLDGVLAAHPIAASEPVRVIFDAKKQGLMDVFVESVDAPATFPPSHAKSTAASTLRAPSSLHQFALATYFTVNGLRMSDVLLDDADEFCVHYNVSHCAKPSLGDYAAVKARLQAVRYAPERMANSAFMREIVGAATSEPSQQFERIRRGNASRPVSVGEWAPTYAS